MAMNGENIWSADVIRKMQNNHGHIYITVGPISEHRFRVRFQLVSQSTNLYYKTFATVDVEK